MAQHEQPDNNYEDLAEQIRKAGHAISAKEVHGGMDVVPEDVRERPLRDFDNTPLDQAIEEEKLNPQPPEDLSALELHPHEEEFREKHIAKKRAETTVISPQTVERKSHRGIAIVAGTAVAALLGGGAIFGLNHGGSEQDQRANNPSASASPNPEKSQSAAPTPQHEVITTPLDMSVDSSVTPLTDNQLNVLNTQNWPNTVEKALAATINPDTLAALTRNNNYPRLLDAYPDWDSLYGLYQNYATANGAKDVVATLGNRNFMGGMYNDDYAATSEVYSNPQNFRNPDTANLIGKAPFVKVSEFDKAARTGDFQSLWDKMYPADRDYEKAFLGELEAGNTSPAIIDQFVKISMLGNELQGNLDVSQTRETAEVAMRTRLTTLYDEYKKDPKTALADYSQQHTAKVTPKVTAMLDGVRLLPGQHVIAGSDAKVTLTTGTIYREYSVTGSEKQDGDFISISVVAFVAAPTSTDKNQYVMPVLLEQISRQIG